MSMESDFVEEIQYNGLLNLLKNSQLYADALNSRINSKVSPLNSIQSEQNCNEDCGKNESPPQTEDTILTRVSSLGFTVPKNQPLLVEGGSLCDFQMQGMNWIISLYENGVNGILADEMGMGKTIQTIAFISYLYEKGMKGPFLIVAPLTTVSNWVSEFETFSPKVPVLCFHGTQNERQKLKKKIKQIYKINTIDDTISVINDKVFPVVITSYKVAIIEEKTFAKFTWSLMVIDEGHILKNSESKTTKILSQFNTFGRLILTGTPLHNNLKELWSLLNFLMPEIFNDVDVFHSWFQTEELQDGCEKVVELENKKNIIKTIHEILKPFLLRRTKNDVNMKLPGKKEVLVHCPLSSLQIKLYETAVNQSIEKMTKKNNPTSTIIGGLDGDRVTRYHWSKLKPVDKNNNEGTNSDDISEYTKNWTLSNPCMLLRKIINHPYQFHVPSDSSSEDVVTSCGKVMVLDAILAKLKETGHKVVVFTFFKTVLDLLEDHAVLRGYKYRRLDGDTSIEERRDVIRDFNSDENIFVFYCTTRAGGLGINLIAADTVVLYDSDWNPQMDLQAQDRCHRIGQTKPVLVYRFCVPGTIDEEIVNRGNAKRRLEKLIIKKGVFRHGDFKPILDMFTMQELKTLLESTDYANTVQSNGYVFSDEELNCLLDRSDL